MQSPRFRLRDTPKHVTQSQNMQPHIEKTVRFLNKSTNPSSEDLLRFLLNDLEKEVREKAFEGLYLKRTPAILLELFHLVTQNEEQWKRADFLTPERMSRLTEEAIRGGDFELVKHGCDVAVRNNLYETLPAINAMLEVPRPEWAELSAETVLKLGTCFYNELADATSEVERRNMDRRREWFASQLEDGVKRYSIHRRLEPIKAYLLVAKKGYPFLLSALADVHSQVCKTIVDLLQNNEEGSYYRLLLSFVDDANSPPVIDLILASKREPKFVRYLLKMVGPNPAQITKDALKRFKEFSWIAPGNEQEIIELIAGEEVSFVQLLANTTLPRETALAMFELVFSLPSVEARRAAVKALRAFNGDDANRILIAAADDPDPVVCSDVLRLLKAKRVKEVDQLIMQNYDRPSDIIRETIYELMPEFRIETFFQRLDQMTENMANILGRVVRSVDPNVRGRISQEVGSAIPVRRRIAINTMRYTKLAPEYEETLIDVFDNDNDNDVRIAACLALGQVLTVDAFQTLQRATSSTNLALQRAGTEAIRNWQVALEQQQQQETAGSST